MRVVFMGTPDFAVSSLQALIDSRHEVCMVVTQPDREKGRGKAIAESPVKTCAAAAGIPVFQPARIKTPEAVSELRAQQADVFVVAAYGQILSEEILTIPRYGCINVHASLLPRLRGASPIQWAIVQGETKSGVTIMQMDKGMDTGAILMQQEVEITDDETGESLYEKLRSAGAPLLLKTLDALEDKTAVPVPQDDAAATYAPLLQKDMGRINWKKPADEIGRLIRGMNPWPGAYTKLGGKLLKIWEAYPLPEDDGEDEGDIAPGTVLSAAGDGIRVRCGKGSIVLTQIQAEGKRRLPAHDYLLGSRLESGTQLG